MGRSLVQRSLSSVVCEAPYREDMTWYWFEQPFKKETWGMYDLFVAVFWRNIMRL